MIKKTIPVNGGKLTIQIPTQLNELRLGQLMQMQDTSNLTDLDAIHILSGVPLQELKNVSSFMDLQQFSEPIATLAHEIKYLYNAEAIPKQITFLIEGKPRTVQVIKNLSVEPAGAFLAARDLIADEINAHINQYGEADWKDQFNPSLKLCSQILAHYFYTRATGMPYDEYQAAAFTEQVEQLPVTDALPIARYFFLSYPNLSKPKTGFWQHLLQRLNKKQASASLKNSDTSMPSMPWPVVM
ncbi:hypothetical protein HH214_04290 [Mucilaginibacter robiniae]|uniref:Uncharacterized protein n=1 Tax=Mucilaginibacter robiniae TaxID=2728022 RepID=A0A7L5DVP3_9SPHI|nr:hypothetical protein [Mucilaginibacter robiniae]QJD95152.1 hypothetical protein HH214_04290 [Mucilaginibacter robiniae]